MTRGQTPVLDEEMATRLKRGRNGHEEPQCVTRGCTSPGIYSLKRVTRGGKIQRGLYCDTHEAIYGRNNLKKLAGKGKKVVIMVDEEGTFEGIL